MPGVAANARTVAYQAAFNASLTSMDRLNDRMDTMITRMASISAEVSSQMSSKWLLARHGRVGVRCISGSFASGWSPPPPALVSL